MVKVRIQKIIWGEKIVRHIEKHKVTVVETEKVINSDAMILEGHSGRKILVNRVDERILSVVVTMKGNKLEVITTRDSDKEERAKFYEYEANKKI